MSTVEFLSGDDLRRAAEQAARLITVGEVEAMQPVIVQAVSALNEVARHGEIASAQRVIKSCEQTIVDQHARLRQLRDVGP